MPRFRLTRRLLTRFWGDEAGSVSIEAAIMTPMMIFLLGMTFVYNDAFRQKSLNTNAAFTISDAISRETDALDDDYLDGMHALFDFLTRADTPTGMRFSLVTWDDDLDDYKVDWTKSRGNIAPLNEHNIHLLRRRLPTLLHNERVIVVETKSLLQPVMQNVGLKNTIVYNLAFSRPRFAPQIVWNEG